MRYNKDMKKAFITIGCVLSVLLIVFLSFVLAFNITYTKSLVSGDSMATTFFDQDRVFINRFEKGKVGDIVVADIKNEENWDHTLEGRYIVKRLVATAGDRVKIVRADFGKYELYVNDKLICTKNADGLLSTYSNFVAYLANNQSDTSRIDNGAVIVKNGEVFLLGDNWEVSYDSAAVGPINESSLVGRVDIIVSKTDNLFWGAIKGVWHNWFG